MRDAVATGSVAGNRTCRSMNRKAAPPMFAKHRAGPLDPAAQMSRDPNPWVNTGRPMTAPAGGDSAPDTHSSRSVKLYMFRGSNAVRTAELMLAHKHIAYEQVTLKRGDHIAQLPALGFSGITVPALTIDDHRIQGTRAISRALDDLMPEPRLFPADATQRVIVEDAERLGEVLQNAARRIYYGAITRTNPSGIDRLAARRHGATDAAVRDDLAALPGLLHQIDTWILAGILGSDQLNAADFQISPNIALLRRFADIAPFIQGRPAAAHATRVAGEKGAHIAHAFPDEWLQPLGAHAR